MAAGLLDSIVSIATGGLGKQITDLITAYFPPDMPAAQKLQLQMDMQKLENERAAAVGVASAAAEQALNERIAVYEGTAADLRTIPILGPIMMFLRGAFRPVMAYAVLYMDVMIYSAHWKLESGSQVETSFNVINFLVLGFFFGERAVQNILPLVTQFLATKRGV